MTSKKLPIHKQLRSPESPKKAKPKKTKAVVAGFTKAEKHQTVPGYVTALRSDGTVNIRINGDRFRGVPTMESYDIRHVGDKVTVLKSGPQYLVVGKVASDDITVMPTIFPTTFVEWSWGINNGKSDKRLWIGDQGSGYRVGRKSERFPTNDADYFARLGICYYNGSEPNLMNNPADTNKQIDLYFERDEWDGGFDGPASFTLFGVKNTGYFPADPTFGSLNYNTGLNPSSIDFTLEPGEMKIITLPDTWRNNIGAATLDANTIRGFVVEPSGSSISAQDVNTHTYGVFLPSISGGLRIFNPS